MKNLLFIIALLVFAGCAGEKSTDTATGGTVPTATAPSLTNLTISGQVQKGPFDIFSNGTIQGQALDGTPIIGQSATVQTTDAIGSFANNVVFTDPLVKLAFVKFTGLYYNENTGLHTSTPLELSSYVFASASGKNNINLISHVTQGRVLSLTQGGKTVEAASIQATEELTTQAVGLSSGGKGSHEMDISDISPLYALSILLQHGVEGASLQALLNAIRTDFADGVLSQVYKDLIKTNATFIDEALIASQVQADLGITVQSITPLLNTLDPSRLITSKHVQGTGVASYSPGGQGAVTRFYAPFTLAAQTQLKYISLPCEASNISVLDMSGSFTGIYDETLNPTMTANIGGVLGSATYTKDALPLRDYGNGVIKTDQATFTTPLDLAAGQYWLALDLSVGCSVQTFEAVPHSFFVQDAPPNKFTYPVTTTGANTMHFEFL